MTNVTAYCKVCKTITEHSVTETKGKTKPTPKRVQCTACQDTHPYRASKPAPRKKSAIKKKASLDGCSYETLMAGRDLSQTTKYEMSRQFGDSELIAHAMFGVGLVTRVLADRKIEVRFPMGTKMLAHDRA